MLGAFIAGLAVAGFGYFLYRKIKKSRDAAGGSGGSGARKEPTRTK